MKIFIYGRKWQSGHDIAQTVFLLFWLKQSPNPAGCLRGLTSARWQQQNNSAAKEESQNTLSLFQICSICVIISCQNLFLVTFFFFFVSYLTWFHIVYQLQFTQLFWECLKTHKGSQLILFKAVSAYFFSCADSFCSRCNSGSTAFDRARLEMYIKMPVGFPFISALGSILLLSATKREKFSFLVSRDQTQTTFGTHSSF